MSIKDIIFSLGTFAILFLSPIVALYSQNICGTNEERSRDKSVFVTCSEADTPYCDEADIDVYEVCGRIRIPLKIYVYSDDEGTSTSIAQIRQTVEQDNTKYANAGIEFFIIPDNGIETINSSVFSDINNFPSVNQFINLAASTTGFVEGVINIYVPENSFNTDDGSTVGAVLNIGGNTMVEQLMFVAGSNFTPSDYTFAHEVGHIFGLYHTFTSFFGENSTCEDFDDCNTGDGISDTPFDDKTYDQDNDCIIDCEPQSCCPPIAEQYKVLYNVMSYYEGCSSEYNHFTPLQSKKMNDVVKSCKDVIN